MRSGGVFDFAQLERDITDLEGQASAADLWSNPGTAHGVMQKLSRLTNEAAGWRALDEQLQTALELVEIAGPDDPDMLDELAGEVQALTKLVDEREIALLLGGPYDDRPAFI